MLDKPIVTQEGLQARKTFVSKEDSKQVVAIRRKTVVENYHQTLRKRKYTMALEEEVDESPKKSIQIYQYVLQLAYIFTFVPGLLMVLQTPIWSEKLGHSMMAVSGYLASYTAMYGMASIVWSLLAIILPPKLAVLIATFLNLILCFLWLAGPTEAIIILIIISACAASASGKIQVSHCIV